MNSKAVLKKVVVIAVVFQLALGQGLFAATTNKNFTLDDNDFDSPMVIMKDEGDKTFTLQKLDAGVAELINNEGSIDFKPSNDTDDYLRMLTTGSLPSIMWVGAATTNAPGIRISAGDDAGQLQYRDENSVTWVSFDSIVGDFSNGGELGTAARTLGNTDAFALGFLTSNTTRLHITSGGNVGIGTATPASALHIAPSTAAALQIDPFNTAAGNTGEIRFLELAASGSNYVGFKAPDLLAGDVIWTLPVADGIANQVLMTDGSGVLGWMAAGGGGGGIYTANGTIGAGRTAAVADTVNFGSNTFVIDGTNNRVGIGTATPGAQLDILGSTVSDQLRITDSALYYYKIGRSGTGFLDFQGTQPGNTGYNFMSDDGSSSLTIRDNGNVGIGTAAPGSKLHVKGALRLSGATSGYVGLAPAAAAGSTTYTLPAADGTNGYALTTNGSGVLSWTSAGGWTDGGTSMYTTTLSDNVGIGTATPGAKLDILGPTSSDQLRITNTAIFYYKIGRSGGTGFLDFQGTQAGFTGYNFMSDDGSSSLTIIDNGNVGIGTSSPATQLHTTGTVRFANIVSGNLQVDASGNVTSSSDERLKDIQGDFTKGLDEILKINPINYRWNEKSGFEREHIYSGFSAQNVESAIPQAVGEGSDGYKTLSDRPITAALVNSAKELSNKVKTLETENAELRSKVETLESLQERMNARLTTLEN